MSLNPGPAMLEPQGRRLAMDHSTQFHAIPKPREGANRVVFAEPEGEALDRFDDWMTGQLAHLEDDYLPFITPNSTRNELLKTR
jgi:hypothetical protein